ncbi:hypothetical protein ACLB2K_057776 [Fragaria x ananassa]
MWLMGAPHIVASIILLSEQQITIQLDMEVVTSQLSFIYAATTARKRKSLWSELLQLRQSTLVAWMAIGDFNSVLGSHECMGGQLPIRSSCEDFRSVTELCNFAHMDTTGAFYTWARGRGSNHIERRLDRALCDTCWNDSWQESSCIAIPRVVSDHNALLFSAKKSCIGGPKPFKFQSMWLLHSSFQDLVANCWRSTMPVGCPMHITLQKLKALKLCLKDWNLNVFGNVHRQLEEARGKLADIQYTIYSHGYNEQLFSVEVEAKTAVLEATRRQEAFWRDKAKVKWLTDGDKCTAFFHAYARNKIARATVNCLHDGRSLLTDLDDISNHVVTFYQSLYGPCMPPNGIVDICNTIPSLITDEENALLTSMPSAEEIKRTVFSMNPLSSPGPDGFPGAFYHNCWDIVGADVDGASSISQFRPIALANFLFKIIPKILADRLGPIASRIISVNQSALLPGRRISDCIGLVSEGFNLLDRKIRGGNVGIKVDIAKAFDTLNWEFLFQTLSQFGFSPDFMNYVSTILGSARLSVLINGSPKGYFACARGVRQGDPLSPLLFCLAEEALSRGLTSLFSSRRVKPISLPRGCSLTHVLYADDLFIFCRGDDASLTRLQSFLESYGQASGQLVNKEKSTFYLGDSYAHQSKAVRRILGFKFGTTPFTYLGVPIFKGMPRRFHLQALADKAKAHLLGWAGKLISMVGRVQLVHDVFQSMLLHSFSTYLWPSSLIKYLSTCARNFIWSGDVGIKKIVIVSWSQICAPKDEGGLGLRHLKSLNLAALLTMGWRVLTANSALGVFARSRFSISHHMKSRYLCSSLWHGLRVSLPILFQNSKWLIGDGNSVNFWSDKWLDVPIVDKLHITISSAHLSSTVAAFISDQNWVLSARFRQAFPDLVKDIMLVPLPTESTNDTLIWEHSSYGVLSFSSAYDQLRPNFSSPPWAFTMWRNFIPSRFSLLAWRLFHHKVPTDDQLQKRGNPGLAACGGVFRDYQGHFIGGFTTPIGHHNAFFSELLAVIIGIELAFQLGWQHVWLECDSTSVVECFSKSSFVPPWKLRTLWYNCVARTRSMSFFCSHVLREGNTVADRLANLGMSSSSWIWHASPPAEIITFLRMDFLGFPYIRHG